jgi:oligopeptide transport system substrate-binding protein
MFRLTMLCLAGMLGSCAVPRADGVLEVSVIGERVRIVDPDRIMFAPPDAVLAGATTMGLVALDSQGQIEPALAESWIVTPDGLSTIFRIRPTKWPDGTDVTGDHVADSLNRAIAPGSRNPLKPLLTSVEAFIGMTGRVVEVRLKTPRPNLLQLLAQPELGIRRNGRGTGPLRITRIQRSSLRLGPVPSEDESAEDAPEPVRMHTERAARAVARFVAGQSDLVVGGTLADWPILRSATLRPGRLRFDATQGLFGLAIVGRTPFMASTDVRSALSMAIDRDALATTIGLSGWAIADTVLPAQLDSALPPARPDWSGTPLAQRRADAAARVANWRGLGRTVPVVRVALPNGPGMRLLFARIAADWRRIGVRAMAVPARSADIDLRLIDRIAPNVSANWYLTTLSCAAGLVCDARGDALLESARAEPTLAGRAARIADADIEMAKRGSFIPLGAPVRWALVDPRLTGWRENVLGAHPLTGLRPRPATNW